MRQHYIRLDIMTMLMCVHFCFRRKFLIKQLCRDHGIQAYMDLVKTAEKYQPLQWISLKEFVVKVRRLL